MSDATSITTTVSASDISEKAKKMLDSKWKIEIYQLDVGQGDAALVKFINEKYPGLSKNILIDGGPEGHNLGVKLKQLLGGKKIDAIILSHLDRDHLDGLLEIKDFIASKGILFRPETKHEDGKRLNKDYLFPDEKCDLLREYCKLTVISPEIGKSIWEYLDKDLFKRIEGSVLVFKEAGNEYKPNILESKIPNITFLGRDGINITDPVSKKSFDSTRIYPGERNNEVSIISLINFYKFFFYTAGDIFKEQEEIITKYFKENGIIISARKVSHHMASNASADSQYDSEKSTAAITSYGIAKNCYHPNPKAKEAAENAKMLSYVYLTNPSRFADLGKKFIVAGDNSKMLCGPNIDLRLGLKKLVKDFKLSYGLTTSLSTLKRKGTKEPNELDEHGDVRIEVTPEMARLGNFLISYNQRLIDNPYLKDNPKLPIYCYTKELVKGINDHYFRFIRFQRAQRVLKSLSKQDSLSTNTYLTLEYYDPFSGNGRKIYTGALRRGGDLRHCEVCLTEHPDKLGDLVFRILGNIEASKSTSGEIDLQGLKTLTEFLTFMKGSELPTEIIKSNTLISKFIELSETAAENLEANRKILGILCDFAELFIGRIEIDEATRVLQEKIQIRAARVGDREEPVEDDVLTERDEEQEDRELIDITKAYRKNGPFSGLKIYTEEQYADLCRKAKKSRRALGDDSEESDISTDQSDSKEDHTPPTAEPSSKEKSQPQEERSETSKSESVSTKSTSRGASR